MNNATEYQTVVEESTQKLDEEVNRLIQRGWQPLGGSYLCSAVPQNILFHQTMILASSVRMAD